jgi:hypothetical protein
MYVPWSPCVINLNATPDPCRVISFLEQVDRAINKMDGENYGGHDTVYGLHQLRDYRYIMWHNS